MDCCLVSYLDSDGVRHSVEVEAETMYEAAALGVAKFRKHGIQVAGLAKLDVEVRSSITHTLTVKTLEDWLARSCKTPKEVVLKERLRAVLG